MRGRMSKGFDMLRDYIEHDCLAMRRRKCCDFEYELQQEFKTLDGENSELRKTLKALVLGTYAEVCAYRGEYECSRCSMHIGSDECAITRALDLLGIDIFGNPTEEDS